MFTTSIISLLTFIDENDGGAKKCGGLKKLGGAKNPGGWKKLGGAKNPGGAKKLGGKKGGKNGACVVTDPDAPDVVDVPLLLIA